MNKSYHKLKVFQKAKELVLLTYKITKKFPKEEQYILVSQMRRAVVSVLANIVEGYSKSSTSEFIRFLDISIGSVTELEIYFDLSRELGFASEFEIKEAELLIEKVKKLLYSFQFSLKKRRKEKLESS